MAILTAALSLIGCDMGVAACDKPKPKTHTVTIEAMRFQPETLTVAAGDTIVWVNKDVVPHTATSRAVVSIRRPSRPTSPGESHSEPQETSRTSAPSIRR